MDGSLFPFMPDAEMHVLQIIAVHADDPEFKGFEDIAQLPKHRLAEIRRCCIGPPQIYTCKSKLS